MVDVQSLLFFLTVPIPLSKRERSKSVSPYSERNRDRSTQPSLNVQGDQYHYLHSLRSEYRQRARKMKRLNRTLVLIALLLIMVIGSTYIYQQGVQEGHTTGMEQDMIVGIQKGKQWDTQKGEQQDIRKGEQMVLLKNIKTEYVDALIIRFYCLIKGGMSLA
jgi:hypothetical protein